MTLRVYLLRVAVFGYGAPGLGILKTGKMVLVMNCGDHYQHHNNHVVHEYTDNNIGRWRMWGAVKLVDYVESLVKWMQILFCECE